MLDIKIKQLSNDIEQNCVSEKHTKKKEKEFNDIIK